MRFLRLGYEGSEGHLGTSLGYGSEGRFWGHIWVISGSHMRPYLRNLMKYLKLGFIRPWVGPEARIWLNMVI